MSGGVGGEGEAELEGPPTPKPPKADEAKRGDEPNPFDPAALLARARALATLFDFASVPRSKAAWVIRIVVVTAFLALLYRRVVTVTRPLLTAHAPSPIPTEEIEDYRFKLPERTRRAIFEELAAAELAERARAIQANTWNGHLWSREDDRGYYERVAVRTAAQRYHCSITQVYLVLDEGIREHWPAPDGHPLPATTPPHSIRTNSW